MCRILSGGKQEDDGCWGAAPMALTDKHAWVGHTYKHTQNTHTQERRRVQEPTSFEIFILIQSKLCLCPDSLDLCVKR